MVLASALIVRFLFVIQLPPLIGRVMVCFGFLDRCSGVRCGFAFVENRERCARCAGLFLRRGYVMWNK